MAAGDRTPGDAGLDGRRVLVTGASSGIGRAVAVAVADGGGRVAALARRAEVLDDLAQDDRITATPADVTDRRAVDAAVARAVDALGGIDAVVNAAGLAIPSGIAEADPDDWRRMFEVNVLGLLEVTQAALPHLRAAGHGDVVNVSSASGRRVASAPLGVYAATKHAVHALSAALRYELREHGIRVTTLAPGFVVTSIFEGRDDEMTADYRDRMARAGLSADAVAAQVVHALAQPPDVDLVEILMFSQRQG